MTTAHPNSNECLYGKAANVFTEKNDKLTEFTYQRKRLDELILQ